MKIILAPRTGETAGVQGSFRLDERGNLRSDQDEIADVGMMRGQWVAIYREPRAGFWHFVRSLFRIKPRHIGFARVAAPAVGDLVKLERRSWHVTGKELRGELYIYLSRMASSSRDEFVLRYFGEGVLV